MNKLFWYIIHWFTGCPKWSVETQEKDWNPNYPDYITPRHRCLMCGRFVTMGKVYPTEPWPRTN